MPQAMEWSFATPITRPRLPCISLPSAMVPSPLLGLFRFGTANTGSDCPMQSSYSHPSGLPLLAPQDDGRFVMRRCAQRPEASGSLEHQRRVGAAEAEGVG